MSDRAKQLLVRVLLSTIFLGIGIAHFTHDDRFLRMMPPYLPAHRALVWVSGVFEILGGIGVWAPWPKLRKAAGYGIVALLVAVYVVNVDMALHGNPLRDGTRLPPWGTAVLWARLPMQFVMMWMAVYATRDLAPTKGD